MRKALAVVTASVFVVLASFQLGGAQTPTQSTTKKTTTTPNKSTPTSAASKAPAKKTGTRTTTASASKRPVQRTTWHARQNVPTPDRYKEIQSALAAKGYMSSEDAQGVWGQSSMDALKRFQADQKLDPTGKINSLSLIALGLGPKHDGPTALPKTPIQ